MATRKKIGLTPAGESLLLQQIALPLTAAQGRLLDASAGIGGAAATAGNASFLHAVLCQAGMPRKRA